jgi:uncharacterized protein (TIGR03083 family)
MKTIGSKEFWQAAVRADGAGLLAAVSEPGALTRPVPSCPEWTVGDLARHVGSFYHRIRLHAGSAGPEERWPPLSIPDEAPAAGEQTLPGWLEAQLAMVEAHLELLDPDLPTWNWAPQARVAAFWHRRAAHETAVHRWDAQLATRLPEPIESKLAGDGVAEVLDTFLPGGRRHVDTEAYGLVQLTATDLGHTWYVRLRGAAVSLLDTDTLLDADEHRTRAAASGSASDLMLSLWGRVPFEVLDTSGDPALLSALRVG